MQRAKIWVVLAVVCAAAACNTVKGVGKDVQSGGQAITGGASKVQKKLP